MDTNCFLQDLETRIHEAGLTMAQVCRKAGLQQSLVSRWKAGVHEPRLSKLRQLEDAFHALRGNDSTRLEDLL